VRFSFSHNCELFGERAPLHTGDERFTVDPR
jgi:hypothetical protein